MLEHAVLVNTGLVGEGVLAHNGLVARRVHAGNAGNQAACRIQPGGLDARVQAEVVGAHLERHDHFLQRAIARTFADAVDGTFDLAGAAGHGGQAVGHRKP